MTQAKKEMYQLSGNPLEVGLFEKFKSLHDTKIVGKIGQTILKETRDSIVREQKALEEGNYYGSWQNKFSTFGKIADIKVGALDERLGKNALVRDVIQEDLTFDNNTGLYTTIVAQFIEQAIQTKLLSNGLLKVLTGIDPSGANSIKIPRQVHHAAGTLGDDGDIATSRTATDYTSSTLTAAWYYCSSGMTEEVMRHSVADLMKDQMISMGYALGKKADQVIVAALETATPAGDANTNYDALGPTTKISWNGLTTVMGNMENEHDVVPNVMVVNPVTWSNMLQDDDIRTGIQYASQIAALAPGFWPRAPGVTCKLLDMDVIVTSLASAKSVYLVDKDWAGYFAPFVPLSVVDGRISGKLAWEIVAYQAYACAVTQTPSVARILELTA